MLIMTSSDRTCLQLRQYLTTMQTTDPPFGSTAGRRMMETLFLSNWQHEKIGERLTNPAMRGIDEVRVKPGEMEQTRMRIDEIRRNRGQPRYKRRRLRGGAAAQATRQTAVEADM